MGNYLFRVLGPEESKNNQIKSVKVERHTLFEYLTRGESYPKSLVSMTALLDYALDYVDIEGKNDEDRKKRKIAVIDKEKLDDSKLADVSSISKMLYEVSKEDELIKKSEMPPHSFGGAYSNQRLHWSSSNIEFIYKGDIPKQAYKIFMVEDLELIYGLVYATAKTSPYPLLLGEVLKMYKAPSIKELNSIYQRNENSNYKAERIYEHSKNMYKYGLLDGYEALYDSLFCNVADDYLPNNEKEIDKLKQFAKAMDESETLKYRRRIDKTLKALMENRDVLVNLRKMYTNKAKNELYKRSFDHFDTKSWMRG